MATSSILVSRPEGEAAAGLCRALEQAGYEAHSQPLMEIHPLPELAPTCRQMLLDLDLYQHIIFISANAVRMGLAVIEDYWPQLPVGIAWYAIGDATAALLRAHGIEAHTPGGAMHSEGLLAITELQRVAGERVLIVKGQGGRDTLGQELSHRGARVDELACYRRACPDLPEGELARRMLEWQIDVVMLSSGEGLANMQVLLSPAETSKFRHIGLIVPSQRVASAAHAAGFDQVVTAENASDAAMLRVLKDWKPRPGE